MTSIDSKVIWLASVGLVLVSMATKNKTTWVCHAKPGWMWTWTMTASTSLIQGSFLVGGFEADQ